MLRLVTTALVAILTLAAAPPLTRAQDEGNLPDLGDTSKPYVAPAPSKSVEIGNYYLKKKKYKAALSRFQEAVKSDPYYPLGYLGLGKVYERIGLKRKALAAYREYLDTLPSTKDAEEAKEVHKAIARLERDLKTPHTTRRSPSSLAHPPGEPR
jgi:tetratricopeptide (TPR) repeat protein